MSYENIHQLRQLAVFASVAESESFAGAARKLQTSRSRVSETISKLEAELNIRLLNRSTRQLTLTADGKAVYQHARQLQQLLDDVAAETQQQSLRGRISLTCTQDVAVKFVAEILAEFEQLYPNVWVELQISDEPLDLIAEEIDLAIRVGTPKNSSLVGRHLFDQQTRLYASPDYLARFGTPQTIDQLVEHRWLVLLQLSGRKHIELQSGEQIVKLTPGFSHLCNAPLMMQKMLCCGMGIGLMLPASVEPEISRGELVAVLPDWSGPTLAFSLLYPSRRQLPLRTRRLIDFLKERLAVLSPSD